MLQNNIPSNDWLIFDDNKKKIRNKSKNIILPLNKEYELIMQKLIDFVRFSQDNIKNKNKIILPAVGLAAPQINENINMYYIRINKNNNNNNNFIEHALINPKIIKKNNKIKICLKDGEGCLSVEKNYEGFVPRSLNITIIGYDYLKKENVKIFAKNYESIVLQHEQDHLNGKLYYDLINNKNPWKKEKNWILL